MRDKDLPKRKGGTRSFYVIGNAAHSHCRQPAEGETTGRRDLWFLLKVVRVRRRVGISDPYMDVSLDLDPGVNISLDSFHFKTFT